MQGSWFNWILMFQTQILKLQAHNINSVQEACAKYFAVQKSEIEIFQITWKKWNKEHQTHSFQFFTNVFIILTFLVLFFMWYTRFQISISELQRICCKLLVLSWLWIFEYFFKKDFNPLCISSAVISLPLIRTTHEREKGNEIRKLFLTWPERQGLMNSMGLVLSYLNCIWIGKYFKYVF